MKLMMILSSLFAVTLFQACDGNQGDLTSFDSQFRFGTDQLQFPSPQVEQPVVAPTPNLQALDTGSPSATATSTASRPQYLKYETSDAVLYYQVGNPTVRLVAKNAAYQLKFGVTSMNLGFVEGADMNAKCAELKKYVLPESPQPAYAALAGIYSEYAAMEAGIVSAKAVGEVDFAAVYLKSAELTGWPVGNISIIQAGFQFQIKFPQRYFSKTLQTQLDPSEYAETKLNSMMGNSSQSVAIGELCDYISGDFAMQMISTDPSIVFPEEAKITFHF